MATETLRPNAAGDETSIKTSTEATHWEAVDDVAADELTTHVRTDTDAYQRDLYNLPASSGAGTINKITVFFRCYTNGVATSDFRASIKSDSTVTDGDVKAVAEASTWETLSQEWATNPADSAAWEWSDIDALQIGISMNGWAAGEVWARCTQVYVEVDYKAASSQGYIIG